MKFGIIKRFIDLGWAVSWVWRMWREEKGDEG